MVLIWFIGLGAEEAGPRQCVLDGLFALKATPEFAFKPASALHDAVWLSCGESLYGIAVLA